MTAPDPEAEYYQAVEEFFVSRRGDPLFLSNADWLLIRRWRQQALPLRIVLRGVADALEGHTHSWGRARKVGSLRYCEAEVEAAREHWERALAIGAEPGVDIDASLLGLARALEGAAGLGAAAADVARRAAAALQAIISTAQSVRTIEEGLRRLEEQLVVAIRAESDQGRLGGIEAGVEATLSRYREKLPAKVFADLRAQSITRALLAAHGLPRLSLFGI